MQSYIVSYLLENRTRLMDEWRNELLQLRSENYLKSVSDEAFERMNNEFMELMVETADEKGENFDSALNDYVHRYIQNGGSLNYLSRAMHLFRRICHNLITESDFGSEDSLKVLFELNDWIDNRVDRIVNDYADAWDFTVEMQKLSLLELSAPLIPVFEGITVMPLIGSVDTTRAKLIMENLLEGVIEHRSKVVLIDITGVPVVDTMVAHHIIEASEAVRLVGTKCILVGIRPEIAQTIVNLGIDLTKFPTKSTLRKGVVTALEMIGKNLTDV
ncbi:STAS domain-containing protein [Bacillus sp. JCM 19041]|uniref:STAS domain-containing protein n=1 Tax=Bacillus sp. JCM 19041 TaxID=1460637 RepID=UPI0006D1B836